MSEVDDRIRGMLVDAGDRSRQATPLEELMARGKARRKRQRRIRSVGAALAVVAIGLGVVALTRTGPMQPKVSVHTLGGGSGATTAHAPVSNVRRGDASSTLPSATGPPVDHVDTAASLAFAASAEKQFAPLLAGYEQVKTFEVYRDGETTPHALRVQFSAGETKNVTVSYRVGQETTANEVTDLGGRPVTDASKPKGVKAAEHTDGYGNYTFGAEKQLPTGRWAVVEVLVSRDAALDRAAIVAPTVQLLLDNTP